MNPVVIMAGGTGGHVFPALAVANELKKRGVDILWIGTQRGLEAKIVPQAGIPIDWISVSGLRGNGLLGWLQAPFRLLHALAQACRIYWRCKPVAVLGMGGFVTGPGGVAAWLLRIPLLIHEQNAVPGLTNRILARFASRVMVGFPVAFGAKVKVIEVGNPIRDYLVKIAEPAQRFAKPRTRLRVLVVGGSLGAKVLNDRVPEAIAMMPADRQPDVWHQTGQRNYQEAQSAYAAHGIQARVVPFIDDMAVAYAWADLVICRSGALTISELSAVGIASILVPYPYAVDDHQTRNAHVLVEQHAAILIPQEDLSVERIKDELSRLSQQPEKLLSMAMAARCLAQPHAARRVADLCLEVANV